ncbi:MAG: hypothetical protein IIC94_07725 [Chloroflexi bacterium]|nr:hypothetical protein [Chloroflexota bacterium]
MQRPPRASGNTARVLTLWELASEIMSDRTLPGGNRDISIAVGNGTGSSFKPWLRFATGTPLLAHDVVAGGIEMAFLNPSGCLTQAYRGTGLFSEPLPVRVVATYPSWDRFVMVVHERTGIGSVAELKERQYPLRVSVRENVTHSTRVLVDQMLAFHGFSLADIESWGGSLQLIGSPSDPRRMQGIAEAEIDAVFDEGIGGWLPIALAAGMRPIALGEDTLGHLEAIGWRRAVVPAERVAGLTADYVGIDFSGWPLYTRASLADETAYRVCAAFHARADAIPWEEGAYTGIGQLGRDTEATPLDVPLHPGAEQWYKQHQGTALDP